MYTAMNDNHAYHWRDFRQMQTCWNRHHQHIRINDKRSPQNPNDNFKFLLFDGNCFILTQISMEFLPKHPVNSNPSLVKILTCRLLGAIPLSEPTMDSSQPTIFSSTDAIMRHSASMCSRNDTCEVLCRSLDQSILETNIWSNKYTRWQTFVRHTLQARTASVYRMYMLQATCTGTIFMTRCINIYVNTVANVAGEIMHINQFREYESVSLSEYRAIRGSSLTKIFWSKLSRLVDEFTNDRWQIVSQMTEIVIHCILITLMRTEPDTFHLQVWSARFWRGDMVEMQRGFNIC